MYLGKHITCKAQGKGVKFGSEDGVVEDCVFPFIYKGKKYNGCSKDGKGKWWCATKVDSKGNMIADRWARCNEYCATDDGKLCILLEIERNCSHQFYIHKLICSLYYYIHANYRYSSNL